MMLATIIVTVTVTSDCQAESFKLLFSDHDYSS